MSATYQGLRGRGRPRRATSSVVAGVALRLFRERGFEATTADEIAAASGIGRSTFFRYFGSKSEILWHCHAGQVVALEEHLRVTSEVANPFAVVANAVVDSTRGVTPDESAAASDYQALVAERPGLDPTGQAWSMRRVEAIRHFIAAELGLSPFDAVPMTYAFSIDAAVRAAGVRFAHSSGAELHELVATSIAPIYAGFVGAAAPRPA